ncbi:MFS transporter [Anaerosalibacter massiliensis]|uniref:MFS transporter n=1 Tax=Anaerosalibacter massiliensis TaxID=1347392 RepID=A0A9X2MI57_9FIRM|nr:MFS transporter [Anaerosalibacter massiliensis]MCR2044089.1 MFS transporter [Anaerosalibacter massiliensis]
MNRNRNVYLLCIIAFLQGLVFYGPVATLFRQNRGLSLNNIFTIEAIFIILMFVFEIPWGYIGDRIGYKNTLVISFFLFFLSKIIFYNAHSFSMFLLESIIVAISISGISGCDSALIYASIDGKDSYKAFSYYSASSTSGFLIASFMNSFIVKYSLDLTAFLTIIPYGIAFVLSFFLVDNYEHRNEEKVSIIKSFKSLRHNKTIFIFIISIALIAESTHALCIFLNQPIYLRSGINIKYFGFLTASMQISCLLSAKAYKMNQKIGTKKLYIILIGMIIVANILLIYIRNWILVIIIIFMIEGAFAITQPLTNTIQNESIATLDRATILSVYAMIGDIVGGFSNLIIGKVSDISLEKSIGVCAVLNMLALILILFFFLKRKR